MLWILIIPTLNNFVKKKKNKQPKTKKKQKQYDRRKKIAIITICKFVSDKKQKNPTISGTLRLTEIKKIFFLKIRNVEIGKVRSMCFTQSYIGCWQVNTNKRTSHIYKRWKNKEYCVQRGSQKQIKMFV